MEDPKMIRSLNKAKIKLSQTSFDNFVLSSVLPTYPEAAKIDLVKYTTASGQTIMVIPGFISARRHFGALSSILRIYRSNLSNSSRIINTLFND